MSDESKKLAAEIRCACIDGFSDHAIGAMIDDYAAELATDGGKVSHTKALAYIAQQSCERSSINHCRNSREHITEYCSSCYARAHIDAAPRTGQHGRKARGV